MGGKNGTAAGTRCSRDLAGSVTHAVALSVDLVGYEVATGPSQVLKIIQSPEFAKAIKEALDKQAGALLAEQQQNRPLSAREATDRLVPAMVEVATGAVAKELRKNIEGSTAYLSVKKSIVDLQCAFARSPAGVFIDEHRGKLYVLAAGVAVGGVTAMYLTRSGDKVAGAVAGLANMALDEIKLGKFHLGVSDVKFVPSAHEVGFGMKLVASDLKPLGGVKMAVMAAAKDDKVTTFTVQTGVRFRVPADGTLAAAVGSDLVTGRQELSLQVGWKKDGLTVGLHAKGAVAPATPAPIFSGGDRRMQELSGGVDVGYRGRFHGVPIDATLAGSIGPRRDAGVRNGAPSTVVEKKVMVSVKLFEFN